MGANGDQKAGVIAKHKKMGELMGPMSFSHISKPGQVRVGYVGSPLPGVEQRISEEGEILVKSPGNMTGYYKMPEKTAEEFTEDGFFKTGDQGEIDQLGRLKITGRIKELFKTSKGKYVAPVPIENQVNNHPRLEACCVTGAGYPQPHAVVMLSEEARAVLDQSPTGREMIEGELASFLGSLNATLPHHERLAFLAVAKDEWLPENGFLTPTMKLKRSRLEKIYGEIADGWYAEKKPIVWQV